MIINSICAMDSYLYTSGYDGTVKRWLVQDDNLKEAGEAIIGPCINAICCTSANIVYAGDTNGNITRIQFNQ